MARRLRKEPTMTWGSNAAGLVMGAVDYTAACVRELFRQT